MRKLLLLIVIFQFAFLLSSCGNGGSNANNSYNNPFFNISGVANLSWSTPSTYADGTPLTVSGYKIYYGTESGYYSTCLANIGNVNTYKITNLNKGTTYYFVVTAFDAAGVESDPTPEQSKTI